MEKEQKSIAVDTGVILAIVDRSDSWHLRCVGFLGTYRGELIVPCAVIPEACYLLNTFLGAEIEQAFLRSILDGEWVVDHFLDEDLARTTQLTEKYRSLNLGFVDASVIAMCERRKISTILTTDRKHFSVVRSKAGQPFQLLP